MTTPSKTLMDLEKKFWQSMVDEDTDAALAMLTEPAVMVNAYGSMKFDHEAKTLTNRNTGDSECQKRPRSKAPLRTFHPLKKHTANR